MVQILLSIRRLQELLVLDVGLQRDVHASEEPIQADDEAEDDQHVLDAKHRHAWFENSEFIGWERTEFVSSMLLPVFEVNETDHGIFVLGFVSNHEKQKDTSRNLQNAQKNLESQMVRKSNS